MHLLGNNLADSSYHLTFNHPISLKPLYIYIFNKFM